MSARISHLYLQRKLTRLKGYYLSPHSRNVWETHTHTHTHTYTHQNTYKYTNTHLHTHQHKPTHLYQHQQTYQHMHANLFDSEYTSEIMVYIWDLTHTIIRNIRSHKVRNGLKTQHSLPNVFVNKIFLLRGVVASSSLKDAKEHK